MGRAYIFQASSCWSEAASLFEHVAKKLPEDLDAGLEAQEELGWCIAQLGRLAEGIAALQAVLQVVEGLEANESWKARVWWRLGQCHWKLGRKSCS